MPGLSPPGWGGVGLNRRSELAARLDRDGSGSAHGKPTAGALVAPLLKRATPEALERARTIVKNAIAESAKRNAARYKNPGRNQYRLRPGTVVGQTVVDYRRGLGLGARLELLSNSTDASTSPPLLDITDEIAEAAALVAEADAMAAVGNVTRRQAPSGGSFWMASIGRKGVVPWGGDPELCRLSQCS